jgi:hypothetical protein
MSGPIRLSAIERTAAGERAPFEANRVWTLHGERVVVVEVVPDPFRVPTPTMLSRVRIVTDAGDERAEPTDDDELLDVWLALGLASQSHVPVVSRALRGPRPPLR